uniref:Uncharacterized protein n=1 Tax=Oryzias latipes TaxID=8090 RepID=A0A3P9IEQ9_ORYLA
MNGLMVSLCSCHCESGADENMSFEKDFICDVENIHRVGHKSPAMLHSEASVPIKVNVLTFCSV